MISVTAPAPTVWPPSRIAKRNPFSSATGVIRLISADHVVSRHHHLHARRQLHVPGHVRRPEIKLRPVAREKRRVPPAFFLRQHVRFRLELRVRRDRSRLGQHLPALHFFLFRAAQQQAHVVSRHPFVQQLAEHLHARHHPLHRRPEAHDLHFLAHLHLAALDAPRHHRAASRNRKNILDRHRERLVHIPHRLRHVLVHRLHQLVRSTSPTSLRPFSAPSADPRITGTVSPGNW